jgi:hypothetical protein
MRNASSRTLQVHLNNNGTSLRKSNIIVRLQQGQRLETHNVPSIEAGETATHEIVTKETIVRVFHILWRERSGPGRMALYVPPRGELIENLYVDWDAYRSGDVVYELAWAGKTPLLEDRSGDHKDGPILLNSTIYHQNGRVAYVGSGTNAGYAYHDNGATAFVNAGTARGFGYYRNGSKAYVASGTNAGFSYYQNGNVASRDGRGISYSIGPGLRIHVSRSGCDVQT